MKHIVDLHIHSKYSRATSNKTDLENLDLYSKIKGINVLGTGDFTHPKWFSELENKLELQENGLYKLKSIENDNKIQFIPTAEIACIFKTKEKCRRLHLLLIAPNLEIVKKINTKLKEIGNLHSDGRPILGLHAKELLNICLNISEDILLIPAHIFTPWFGLYGSKSGFDKIEDCFEDLTKYIYALETGLSADPEMIYKVEETKNFNLISNSDAHSPDKLGREANIFEGDVLSYTNIIGALKNTSTNLKLSSTIEFFPEEGKYYNDGHEKCKINFSPEETIKNNGICPVCKRALTKGVLYRVQELSSRRDEACLVYQNNHKSFHIAPLRMIISQVLEKGETTKTVENEYNKIIQSKKSEFDVLIYLDENELSKIFQNKNIVQAIIDVRNNNIQKIPGYDGVFGVIKIKKEQNKKEQKGFGF